MEQNKKDIRQLLKEHLPRPTHEELEERAAAHQRTYDQLRAELQELQAELETRTLTAAQLSWPGAVEPLVLAAAFVLRGEADADNIADKIRELSSGPLSIAGIRFAIQRLVRRGLLSENDRCFTVTPTGERELAQARDDAKRWMAALDNWSGPKA